MDAERKARIIRELNEIADAQEQAERAGKFADIETDHIRADDLLLKALDDADIEAAYDRVSKWYA